MTHGVLAILCGTAMIEKGTTHFPDLKRSGWKRTSFCCRQTNTLAARRVMTGRCSRLSRNELKKPPKPAGRFRSAAPAGANLR